MSRPSPEAVPARDVAADELLESAYRYAMSLTHEPADAEDLIQDACLAILASGAPWERPYLFATIRNRFIDRYRRRRKLTFVALGEGDGSDGAEPRFDEVVPDVLESGLLERALGSLRVEEREALFLAVVEGYTVEEIGRLTSRPRGTILSLLHRTKGKLRDLLGGSGGGRP
ncbi:MAG TPA: RNA polymerase sigma factor [Thermoanaerobaculia bacterium]|nr:RNA polymerase sigma factor [Thermoanaerobaculia bacterium]